MTQPWTRMQYQISPYHFTDRPHEMIAFLQAVGLRVEASKDGWAELVGAGGRVGDSHPGQLGVKAMSTSLCLLAPDAIAVADQLQQAGLEARWWDESFGRQAAVRGPYGELTNNEPMTDFHGYQRHDVTPAPGDPEVTLVAVLFTPDFELAAGFFAGFGFVGDERRRAGDRCARTRRPVRSVCTRLIRPGPGLPCGLSFETSEDLSSFASGCAPTAIGSTTRRDRSGGDRDRSQRQLDEVHPAGDRVT